MIPYIPAFRREKEQVSGAVRGSAFHRVMELLDFDKMYVGQFSELPKTYEAFLKGLQPEKLADNLHAFLLEEVKSLRLTEEYFNAVREQKIVHFLQLHSDR